MRASDACAVLSSSAHPRCHFNGPRLAIAGTCAWLWVEEALHFCDTVRCRGQSAKLRAAAIERQCGQQHLFPDRRYHQSASVCF